MNRKTLLGLVLSLLVHALLFLYLPGFGQISWDDNDQKTVRITLASHPEQSEIRQKDPVDKIDKTPEENSKTSNDQQSPEQLKTENPTNKSKSVPERHNQSEDIDRSQSKKMNDAIQDQAEKETNQTVNQQDKKETTEGSGDFSEDRALLNRGGRFRTRTTQPKNNTNSLSPSSSLSNKSFKKYDISRIKPSSDTTVQQLVIREPENTSEQRMIQNQPNDMKFTLNQTETSENIDVQDFIRIPEEKKVSPENDRGILSRPIPDVPGWLERKGEEVKVTVHYEVNSQGEIISSKILSSSGYTELDENILDTIRKWKYEPGFEPENHVVVFKFKLEPEGTVS